LTEEAVFDGDDKEAVDSCYKQDRKKHEGCPASERRHWDEQCRNLAGTQNKGRINRLDHYDLYTIVYRLP